MAACMSPEGAVGQAAEARPGNDFALSGNKEGTLIEAVDVPKLVFYLPQSCYGSSLILPLIVPMHNWVKWAEFAGTQYILLAINFAAQTTFIVSTYDLALDAMIVASDPDLCTKLSVPGLVVSIWAFICTILTDLQETADLLEIILRQLHTTPRTEVLKFTTVEDSGEIRLSGGGISKAWKAFLVFVLVLPKGFFAIALMLVGCSFLAHSESDSDIILNCFALVFILQIDELIFYFLSPPKSRRLLEAVPPFIVKGEVPAPWSHWSTVSQPAKLLVSGLLVAVALVFQERCGWEPQFEASFVRQAAPAPAPASR